MPTVTPTYPADDTGADVSDYNLIIQSILAVFNGNIDADNLVTSAITTPKIANDAVTTAKLADANVTTAKLADANVTTAKLADANVTTAKLAINAATNVFYDTVDVAKTVYSTYTTFHTFNVTPTLSGVMTIHFNAYFGFDPSAGSGMFKIRVDGASVSPESKNIKYAAGDWSTVSLLGYKAAVVGGTTYSITVQTNGGGDDYYIQPSQLIVYVNK